jgi:hypothetical protein
MGSIGLEKDFFRAGFPAPAARDEGGNQAGLAKRPKDQLQVVESYAETGVSEAA